MSVHDYVRQRFQEVFGPPHNTLIKDEHWAIALQNHRRAAPINVLLNGSAAKAVVWVFDPHDMTRETLRKALSEEAEVDAIIQEIQRRAARSLEPGP